MNEWQVAPDHGGEIWLCIIRDIIYQSSYTIPGILNRDKIYAEAVMNIESWTIYDENYYYLSDKMLDKFCEPVKQSLSMRQIKEWLFNSGILVGEGKGRQYFTVKVPIVTEYGAVIQPRRLRLARTWLDLDGNLTWKETIEANGGNGVD